MELHRRDAACAVCHRILDPLGLGFENFDGVGRWRDEDAGKVVEDSAVADFFRAPKHPYSAALLAATPKYTDPLAGLQPVPEAVIAAVRAEVGHG